MLKQVLRFRVVMVVLLALALSCPSAFARGEDRGHDRGGNKGSNWGSHNEGNRGFSRGESHYYRNGQWYRHGWFGFGVLVSALAIGAFIEALPPRHTTVVVAGTPYYYDNQYYYRSLPDGGYVVAPPPAVFSQPVVVPAPVIVQPQSQIPEMSTVNIPNSRGGYTSVNLRRSGNGFVGPQGEYYSNYPSVDQLRVMYGN